MPSIPSLPPSLSNAQLTARPSGILVPAGTARPVGESVTASGIIIPAPRQIDTPTLVTAKETTTGELVKQFNSLHAAVAATQGKELANFRFAGAIQLAERVDRDARREQLIKLLEAGLPREATSAAVAK